MSECYYLCPGGHFPASAIWLKSSIVVFQEGGWVPSPIPVGDALEPMSAGLHHSWTRSGWSNFPKASWENLQDAVPGEADPAATPLCLLPFMEKYRQYWCPTSLQANAWLPSGLTTASSDWFVLGPGLEENRFPKKAV